MSEDESGCTAIAGRRGLFEIGCISSDTAVLDTAARSWTVSGVG